VSFLLIFITVMALACQRPKNGASQRKPDTSPLDTAIIHKKLREYEAVYAANGPGQYDMLQNILKDAIAMGYNDQACFLSMDFARHHADRTNFDSSLYYYNKARQYCNKPLYDSSLPAAFLAEFGAFYYSTRSDYLGANKCYYDALHYLKENKLDENELTITLCVFLFETQQKLGHHKQALEYLKEGEQMARKLHSKQGIIIVWNSYGEHYAKQRDYGLALNYYDSSIQHEPDIWDPNILTNALTGKGRTLIKMNRASEAIAFFEKAFEVAKKEHVAYTQVEAVIGLGSAYNQLGRYREAIAKVTPVLKTQSREFTPDQEEGLQVLMEAYEKLGEYRQALDYQRKLRAWQDSVADIQKTVAINELELKFQTAIKDKEIASRGILIEKQKATLSKKNTLIISIAAVAFLALLFAILLYKNIRHRQRVHQLQLETMRRQQEIEVLKSTMQGEEYERKRLSRELHDGIGAMLSSIIMKLSMLKDEDSGSHKTGTYNEVITLLHETATEVRRTAQNMMPDILEKLPLEEAIKNYAANISKGTALEINVQFYGNSSEFAPHCKLVIYRIVQELLHNIVKHSQATQVIVQGVWNEDNFTVTVEDNGTGFDISKGSQGMGLRNVESRVKSLQGEFQLESSPGKGTTVYMEFKCKDLQQEI
jgi:two-component system, NarL family, sensor kinase